MRTREMFTGIIAVCCYAVIVTAVSAGEPEITPDLSAVMEGKTWGVHNRTVKNLDDGSKKGIELNARENDGLVWLKESDFSEGTIECDIQGKDVTGQSFAGIAFHGQDEQNYDAVYFRPFNFRNEDNARRAHAVQYISHPEFTWNKLRTEHPGKYENALKIPPDPKGWFHARIVIDGKQISAFVNDDKEPSLIVEKIGKRNHGWFGFWVGNGSDGKFANLKVIPKEK